MAISVLTGKPGNGKTLTMVHLLIEDLIRTERHIVTNIPLNLPELAEYLEILSVRRGIRCPKLHNRLTLIDTVDSLMFWRFRASGLVLPKWDGKGSDGRVLPEEELLTASVGYWRRIGRHKGAAVPTSYYISEAHRYFNAKRFQAISVIAELYVTHHRHLHDEVFFDTQFAKQLSVALRELTEEWHVLRNDYNRNVGFVKMVPRIRMSSYYEMPTGSQKPFAKRSFQIEENGAANCYQSTGALGAIERAQSTESKKPKKGIPLKLFIGLIVLAIVAFFAVLSFAPRLVLTKILGTPENSDIVDYHDDTESNWDVDLADDDRLASSDQNVVEPNDNLITLESSSFFILDGRINFRGVLSDGSIVTNQTPGFGGYNPDSQALIYRGQVIHFVPAPVPASI